MKRLRWIVLSIVLVLILLIVLGRAPWLDAEKDSEWLVATASLSKIVDVDGVHVRLIDIGQGQPILLLHGWMDSTYTWRDLIPQLQSKHRLIAFDFPGFGYSDKPDRVWSFKDYADFTSRLLDVIGVKRVFVVGNSMGGGVALRFAADYPTRTRGVVAIDAAVPFEKNETTGLLSLLNSNQTLTYIGIGLMGRNVHSYALESAVANKKALTDAVKLEMYLPNTTSGARSAAARQFNEIRTNRVPWAVIETIKSPTMIIWGDHDTWIPPQLAKRLAEAIPGSELHMLEGIGHLPQWEAPAATAGFIDAFVSHTSETYRPN